MNLNSANLGLGVDTGGTFTDVAVVEMTSGRVLASAKAPTTRHDLAKGIASAVRQVPEDLLRRVGLVSLSTTLATNAIVEGNGSPTCLVLIGYDRELFRRYELQRLLPTANLAFVKGGHNGMGAEQEPLDESELRRLAREQRDKVAAFAVSGFFGVRNADHEMRAKRILIQETGLPVTCGHELASELDSVLRAATCALNASLVPLLRDLMVSLRRALDALGVRAPVMVVRGDGSLMRVEMALDRPVETILSGPAASVVGARALAGLQDMLVVDIGGTTTDLALVRGGLPLLNPRGATVGRWRTLVRAVQTVSSGLGGDSQVTLLEGTRLCVGPRRAVPLAFAAQEHPQVIGMLEETLTRASRLDPSESVVYLAARSADGNRMSPVEQRILEALGSGPQPLWRLATRDPWVHFYLSNPNRLEGTGVVLRSAFTPTDALHALGEFVAWDAEAAMLGARLLAWYLQASPEEVSRRVLLEVRHSLIRAMVAVLVNGSGGSAVTEVGGPLLDLALSAEGSDLEVRLRSRVPVVGLGAPAGHFVSPAARVMGDSACLPQHHSVANAVGAISGSVAVQELVSVQPVYRASGLDGYVLTGPFAAERYGEREAALEEAQRRAHSLARQAAEAAGAADIEVRVEVKDHKGTAGPGFGDRLYLGSTVTATAVGRPRFASEAEPRPEEEALW
ncbi:MAG: hydantoinase/oxoprolinase family protein [Anaerolineae bacterium]|nr:hydantoinase/oxoprolinase family protein [Anaerolineae bacterium]